ncbi:MAG: hypothetical protein HOK35_13100 [Cytophagia bacterium]|nr:hypothetical protein [Cytophagia bacterium]
MKKYLQNLLPIIQNKAFQLLLSLLFLTSLTGCKYLNGEKKAGSDHGKTIATVGDVSLFEADLDGIINSFVSHEDSVRIRKNFIDNWIKDELVYQKALSNLTKTEKDKTKEIDNYYRALITYEYENKLIKQQLSDEITEDEIIEYYEKNNDQFILQKCIMQVIFIKLKNDAPDITKVKQWYLSDKNADHDLLFQYCLGNVELFNLDDEKWFFIDDVKVQIPLKSADCISYYNNMSIESSDSLFTYLLRIKKIKKEGGISPIEFEHERIKQTILHKKSLEFLKEVNNQIYTDGIKKKHFKIYE